MKNIQNLLQKAAFSLILSAICHLTIEGQEIIHEGFDNGTTAPPGWTIKAGGTYASATNSGAAIPSIKLSATGNYIETCDFKNANECSFWIKGVSIDTISALLVQCKSEGYWINLDSITNLTNSKKTLTYTLPDSSTKLRFTYYKSKGNLAFDDLIFKNSVPVKDTVPPAFIDNSPVLINKTDSSATYNINTDKPGTIFYFLTTPDFQSISLADLINQSGNVLKNGKIILINNTDTSITINGLEKNKKYCIHWVSSLSNEISLNSKITISKLSLLTDGCNLFFSEMIKGTGNNKAIEIFNPTGDTISFNNYRIAIASDGSGWKTSYYIFPKNAIIAPQDVFVIVKSNSDSIDLKLADALTNGTVVNFTGNDARGLQEVSENDSIWKFIDVFGDPNSSKNISIAGIEGAASNHSIIRKKYITHGDIDWTLSSGSSEKNSEWIISKLNDFSNLGKHNFQPIIKLKFDSIFFDYQEIPVFIDTISHSMTFTLHSIADINNLRLKYYIPDGIEIMPDPSTLNDYSKPVNFKLLNANNNDSIEWALNVIVDEAPKIIDIKYNKITCDTFTLVFNKPISFNPSQSSATRNHLFIHEFNKNELIPIGSFVSEDYTKIKVVPKQKLKSSCNYTLSIDSISDNSDNLMLPYEFNFTTNAVIVDLGSQNALEILSIWPNPAQGIINVKVPYEFDSNNLRVEFVNIDGKVIQPISIENSSIIVINISNLKNGNYYLKVSDHSKILAKQVIIKNK